MPNDPTPRQLRSALHALDYQRPRNLQLPPSLNLGLARLREAAEDPRSPRAIRLREALGQFRYGAKGGGTSERQRRLRTDAMRNSIALLSAAVASVDIGSLLLARPAGDERPCPWAYRRLDELGFFAYGPEVPDARSTRREERAWRRASDGGLLGGVERWTKRHDGEFRAKVSLKQLGGLLVKILDLGAAITRDRREAQRRKAEQKAKDLEAVLGGFGGRRASKTGQKPPQSPQGPQQGHSGAGGHPPPPKPPRGPGEFPQEYLDAISFAKKRLGVK